MSKFLPLSASAKHVYVGGGGGMCVRKRQTDNREAGLEGVSVAPAHNGRMI